MKKIILMFVVIMMTTMSALAQFPNHVREVMKKCDAKMATYNDGTGVVLDGTLKMKASVLSLKGTMKSYVKDSKYFNILSMNAMGKEMLKMEMGFDGEQQWVYTVSDGSKDSLEITKTKAAKNEYGMKSDYDKEYSKAKMKEVGRYYEISFSGPKKKDIPKKAKIKVDKENYLLREYSVEQDLGMFTGTITITITKITKGCSNNWFKLDMNRYKKAAVSRR